MKKTLFLLTLVLALATCQKPAPQISADPQLQKAKEQVANYQNYQPEFNDLKNVKKSDKGDIYFFANDNKHYIFPNEDVFKSWFGQQDLAKIEVLSTEKFYQSQIGGIVTLRPGSLLLTPTVPFVYLVVKNGELAEFANQDLVAQIYGTDWQKQAITLPNFYFTQYKRVSEIKSVSDFPAIPLKITINQDKGF